MLSLYCNNIHTYARSDYIKTNQTSKVTVAEQKTDEGQADSGILSRTFGAGRKLLLSQRRCKSSESLKPFES